MVTAPDLAASLALADPATGAPLEQALQAARAAQGLATDAGCSQDAARAVAWQCAHLLRLGRYAEVLEIAPRAVDRLQALDLQAVAAELQRVLTLAACETGDFDVALDTAQALEQSTAMLGDPGAALTAAFALAVCFDRLGDPWQSVRVLSDSISENQDRAPDRPLLVAMNALCAVSLGEFHRLRDAVSEAEIRAVLHRSRDAGERAQALLERLPDPVQEVAVLGNLGEALLHLGEQARGEALLQQAAALADERGLKAYQRRLRCSLGEARNYAGQHSQALDLVEPLLAELGSAAPPELEIRAREVAWRAQRALRQFERALAQFEALERLSRKRTAAQLRAQSQLFVTRTEAQRAKWQAQQALAAVQQHKDRADENARSAERDTLTGLGNRRHLHRRCQELLPAAAREGLPLALALIDIDRFKSINDSLGHAMGDRVLVALAQLLRDNMRSGDVLARYGGEEFVLVMPGSTLAQASDTCERLRLCLAAHAWAELGVPGFGVTASLGLAAAPSYELSALLQRADEALYRAKREGRDCVRLAD